jgi:hypothetical protein
VLSIGGWKSTSCKTGEDLDPSPELELETTNLPYSNPEIPL